MKKLIILILLLGLVSGCSKPAQDGSSAVEVPAAGDEAGGEVAEGSDETTKWDLSDLFGSGKEMKCTATVEGYTTDFWIKDAKERIETETPQGKSISIFDGKVIYTWAEGSKEGVMMDLEKMEELAEEMESNTETSGMKSVDEWNENAVDIDCSSASVPDSMLTPPSDVSFRDMAEILEQMKEISEKLQGMDIPQIG